MRTRNAVLAGVGAAAGLVIAANGFRTVSYGPRSQDVAKAGENISDVMNRIGAPFETYPVGQQIAYRFGAGTQRHYFIASSFDHDELLVIAGPDGRITSSRFMDKASGTQIFGFIHEAPMP